VYCTFVQLDAGAFGPRPSSLAGSFPGWLPRSLAPWLSPSLAPWLAFFFLFAPLVAVGCGLWAGAGLVHVPPQPFHSISMW
jgi:hypothetical protein